ncbi:diaminopimelate epimerase [Desulfocurvus sp.]|uniref:diaminopimelate epimerase n=1 Tax=Desulfocurvus sp. TaxID=2871698 RepID=UPI0025C3355F|nr:diaminopimelate epimerase [Desulfocurvus sp.]MCK9240792.1 diaminopimelate epimerase [Desulfocurvus sp.]
MNTSAQPTVSFYKMHGSGNDFVLIDNRALRLPREAMPQWARRICRTAFGVGADGLILLDTAPAGSPADYVWDFHNADGSRAAMCGNGSRCAARLAHALGMAGPTHVLGTDAGPIRARVNPGAGTVRVQLTPPHGLALGADLDVDGQRHSVHFVDTGVPHAVVFPEGLAGLDVRTLGRALRTHPHFAPAGANVNFARVDAPDAMTLRTYERGVENETYACGTGAAATVLVANALGLVGTEVRVTTSGGEVLQIGLENGTVFLEGPAVVTYQGQMFLDSLGLTLP